MFEEPEDSHPLPPPHARAWVHPSELGPIAPPPDPGSTRRPWFGIAAASIALIGAVSLVAVALVGRNPQAQTRLGIPDRNDDSVVVTIDVLAPDTADPRGSGISIGSGLVVTSATLIAQGATVRINNAPATVLSVDPSSDVAVLTTPLTLPSAVLASSARFGIGDPVMIATRAANGVGTTRFLRADIGSAARAGGIMTDIAPLADAPGSAALDARGAVAGLVSGIRTPDGNLMIIPIEKVRDVVAQIRRPGTTHRTLGISVTNGVSGPVVQAVLPDRPAARAGLLPGDTILAVGSTSVPTQEILTATVQGIAADVALPLVVLRGGSRLTLVIAPEAPPTGS